MLKKSFFITFSLLLLSSCASLIDLDKKYLSKTAYMNYTFHKNRCFDAVKAVVDDFGGQVQKEHRKRGIIVTNRFNLHKGIGVNNYVNYYEIDNIKIDHKFYLKISGDNAKCNITFLKYRYWSKNNELKKINERNFISKVLYPFFKEVGVALKDDFSI